MADDNGDYLDFLNGTGDYADNPTTGNAAGTPAPTTNNSGGILGFFTALANSASTAYNAQAATAAQQKKAATSTLGAASSITKYIPYIIGGVLLLAVVGFLFRRK